MEYKNKLSLYLMIVFGVTYPAWIFAAVISNIHPESVLIFPLHLLGGASPFIATIIYLVKTHESKDYWRRLTNIRETNIMSWLVVMSPMGIMILAQLLVYQRFEIDSDFRVMGITYGIGLLFFGPIPEEMGWRGVLFHTLSLKSFAIAQGIMTLVWFLWHLPLFFIVGSYQHGLGIWSIDFIFFATNIVLQSLIMGYLYVIGHKNIILPILFHYFVNLFGEMFVRSFALEVTVIMGYAIVLIGLCQHMKPIRTRRHIEISSDV